MSGLPSPELSTLLVDLWMVGLFFVGGWDIPMNTDSQIHGETVRELHLRAVEYIEAKSATWVVT